MIKNFLINIALAEDPDLMPITPPPPVAPDLMPITPRPFLKLDNPLQVETIAELINAILNLIVQIGIPVIVLMIVYSGFLFVKAQGNEDKISEAKATFFWTIIGAAIVLGAFLISEVLTATIKGLK